MYIVIEVKEMAKVKKIKENQYEYICGCGKIVILETDLPLDKLSKCWNCQKKIDELKHTK